MKVYLAEHPGKTNKDAMKHVCLPILSTFLIPHQVFRLARFGKMHRKTQSAARKLRRRTPRLLSGRRKLHRRSPRMMRVPRLSLAATNERLQIPYPTFGQSYSLRRFGPFGILLSISAQVFALYFIRSSCPSYYCCVFSKGSAVYQC